MNVKEINIEKMSEHIIVSIVFTTGMRQRLCLTVGDSAERTAAELIATGKLIERNLNNKPR